VQCSKCWVHIFAPPGSAIAQYIRQNYTVLIALHDVFHSLTIRAVNPEIESILRSKIVNIDFVL
jgi:hypothetical protein